MTLPRSSTTTALVLKRREWKEADWLVTLLTKDYGKLAAVAKGARKIKSTRLGKLEPRYEITAQLVKTKALPILTQCKMTSVPDTQLDLTTIRRITQILETLDRLIPDQEPDEHLYHQAHVLLSTVIHNPTQTKTQLNKLMKQLGYAQLHDDGQSFLEYVSKLSDKPMRSWDFLRVK